MYHGITTLPTGTAGRISHGSGYTCNFSTPQFGGKPYA